MPTLEMLYISYPITWALAAGFDFICYLVVKKRLTRELGADRKPRNE